MGYDGKYYGKGMTKEQKLADLRERLSGFTILKDSLKGSVYYAVVRDEKRQAVFCVVGKTVMSRDGYFMVKMMGDDECPCYYDCPASYIKMCTEPYNEWADEWRKKCLANVGAKNVPMEERRFTYNDREFTIDDIVRFTGVWKSTLMRSQIVRRQKVGGSFILGDRVFMRTY